MSAESPYSPPTSAPSADEADPSVRWKLALGYGVALFLSGVAIGAIQPAEWEAAGTAASLITRTAIHAHFAFWVRRNRLMLGVLATVAEVLLTIPLVAGLSYFVGSAVWSSVLLDPTSWAITVVSLVVGVAIGTLIGRRNGAGPNNSSKPTPLRGAA